VIKTVLQLQHRQLVPSLNSQPLNPHIQLENSPFFVVSDAQAWVAPTGRHGETLPRSAGVSSFGFGGVNAHILLQEYPTASRRTADEGAVMVVLSARSESALRQRVEQLYSHLSEHEESLTDLAYTLQVGRDAMEHRMALVADCQRGLMAQLRCVLDGVAVENIWRGEIKRTGDSLSLFRTDEDLQQAVESWIAKGKLDKLAELWVQGMDIAWSAQYVGQQLNRLRLPTYPFARERCWFPENAATMTATALRLHPLVHRNISDINELRYSSLLVDEEWLLRDHQVMGRGVLPGVAQLEWARAAVSLALSGEPNGEDFCLENVTWLRPLTVTGELEVHIALVPQDDGRIAYEIYSGEREQTTIYSQGYATPTAHDDAPLLDLSALTERCTLTIDGAPLYAQFARLGLCYGEGLRVLQTLRGGDDLAVAELAAGMRRDGYLWSPNLLDGALQSIVGTAQGGELALPFALREIRCWAQLPDRPWVVVQAGAENTAAVPQWDISIADDDGRVVMQMKGCTMRLAGSAVVTTQQANSDPHS
jgi:polyketide synthase PksN